jgi:hypothetical protein
MKKFVKITTRKKDGTILRSWIDAGQIAAVSQDTSQEGNNEGKLLFFDGETRDLIAFNETLDSLK